MNIKCAWILESRLLTAVIYFCREQVEAAAAARAAQIYILVCSHYIALHLHNLHALFRLLQK